ncbi:bestrophin-like domain [Microbulbifer celer]|uniref:DUF4239 domain-containing protein n=1 Tax=Microbulbifer celer TaxID=435905 RepID=A0ABW3U7U4_9GAMM|nr:hypothetical protein [Microbulbifer celer]UFN57196.1 hypothetical protein LPW13_16760 [Microbulbifer celer]
MFADDAFYSLPLLAVYLITVLVVLAAMGVGLYLGHRYIRHAGTEREPSIGSAVTATLGLLAFLLAFTFNMTADRYNQRKALLLSEVNALHTTYLHTDFLRQADRAPVRLLLEEYIELRDFNPAVDGVSPEGLERSVAIHNELWAIVDRHIADNYSAGYLRQFVEPLTEVINYHNSRVVIGLEYRIPGPIWIALYFLTALAMLAIGFQFGVSRSGSLQVSITLALTFATVIVLIADLDRATEGVIIIEQRPMAELKLLIRQKPVIP